MKYTRKLLTRAAWRKVAVFAMVFCVAHSVDGRADEGTNEPAIRYIPLAASVDAPAGMFKTAVIVDEMPLVHTRQLFSFDRAGTLVGEESAENQIEQVLSNLETVLKDSSSDMDRLIRVNVYALSSEIVARFHRQLGKRLGGPFSRQSPPS